MGRLDDRWFYRRLFRERSELASRLDISLLGLERTPAEYVSEFRKAHVALVMRFHSLVFSLSLDVPAVAIDYTLGTGKVHALATRFGGPHCSLDELSTDFLVREIQTLIDDPQPQRANWAPKFAEVVQERIPTLLMKRTY